MCLLGTKTILRGLLVLSLCDTDNNFALCFVALALLAEYAILLKKTPYIHVTSFP